MKSQTNINSQISRRKFLGGAAVLATSAFLPSCLSSSRNRLSSEFGRVQVGAISYSFRSMPGSAENILEYLKTTGLSSVELMGDAIENFAGIPQYQGPTLARGEQATDQQRAEMTRARAKNAEEVREWRRNVSMARFRELRKMYNNAGVNIDISKIGNPNWTDEEIDYAFNVAKNLGSRGITFEIGIDAAKRMAPFAEKHNMYAIMHNHGQPGQPGFSFEEHLAYGRNLMLNFDVGHYWGATGLHPNGIIEKLHDRIISLHIKDKTGKSDTPADTNMPWGKGSTPLADVLLLLKRERWPITADIELEYNIPPGSDAVAEVRKCVDYCRDILA
jgi:sugar phosphate isomerase/epimerase